MSDFLSFIQVLRSLVMLEKKISNEVKKIMLAKDIPGSLVHAISDDSRLNKRLL